MRHVNGLWRHRFDRDIAPALVAWHAQWQDDFAIRFRIAIRLGQLEYGPARLLVRMMLRELPRQRANIDQENGRAELLMALARIENRHLSGRDKLDAVAAKIGRSFDDLLERKILIAFGDGPVHIWFVIQNAFFEVLLSMAQAGHDVSLWFKQVGVGGAERFQIEGAHLPVDDQVTRILDYLCALDIGDHRDAQLATYYLPLLGAHAADLLLTRLQAMLRDFDKYFRLITPTPEWIKMVEESEKRTGRDLSFEKKPRYNNGYIKLFRAAHATGDARFVPLLREFEAASFRERDPRIFHYARQSRENLETRLSIFAGTFVPLSKSNR